MNIQPAQHIQTIQTIESECRDRQGNAQKINKKKPPELLKRF